MQLKAQSKAKLALTQLVIGKCCLHFLLCYCQPCVCKQLQVPGCIVACCYTCTVLAWCYCACLQPQTFTLWVSQNVQLLIMTYVGRDHAAKMYVLLNISLPSPLRHQHVNTKMYVYICYGPIRNLTGFEAGRRLRSRSTGFEAG